MSKTLISGTAYTIDHGNTLISGTGYEIDHGLTLIGGTSYDIELAAAGSSPYSLSDWPGWSSASWEDVNNLCYAKQQGYISAWPSDVVLGATKKVDLSTTILGCSSYIVQIIDLDKDGSGVITFCSQHTSNQASAFYTTSLSAYAYPNYESSDLKNFCTSFYNAMENKSYVKQLTKKTGKDGYNSGGPIRVSSELLGVWLLSRPEIGLAVAPTYYFVDQVDFTDGVTSSYAFFTDATSRKKCKFNSSSGQSWWLRSLPVDGSYQQEAAINSYGTMVKSNYSEKYYFVPAFAIGNPSAQTVE